MRVLHVVFIVGLFVALHSVLRPCPLLEAGPSLLGLVCIFFCAGGVLFSAEKDEGATVKYVFAAFVPWLFAALLIANWKFDTSENVAHQTVVIRNHYGRYWNVVTVKSWRKGRSEENIYLKSWLFPTPGPRFFHAGEPLTISVGAGALHMAWIGNISPTPYPKP